MMLTDRRGFFIAASSAALTLFYRTKSYRTFTGPRLNIILIDTEDAAAADVRRGVAMGVDEASRSAQLFGGWVRLSESRETTDALSVVIGGTTLPQAISLSDDAVASEGLYLNVAVGDAAVRDRCVREVFHFAPADGPRRVVAWSPLLVRFGADTLNKRYRHRYQLDMTPLAWTSWFAVKVAWEASLAGKATTSRDLLKILERPSSKFDGHKGEPLYFDARHQLVQPVYTPDGAAAATVASTSPACKWKE
jgi:hypothetical protein